MTAGRPHKSHLAATGLDGAWHELLVVGADDRLRFPVDVWRRRPWLGPGQELLAILSPQHSVRLAPISDGKTVETQLRALAAEQNDGSEYVELAIRRRYLRLRVNSDSRVVLPKSVRLCLGLDAVGPAYVSLVVGRQQVRLERGDASIYQEAEELLEEYELP